MEIAKRGSDFFCLNQVKHDRPKQERNISLPHVNTCTCKYSGKSLPDKPWRFYLLDDDKKNTFKVVD